jgi:hypothetical protein
MSAGAILQAPKRSSYDVVIVGGAIMGSSIAWFPESVSDDDCAPVAAPIDGAAW